MGEADSERERLVTSLQVREQMPVSGTRGHSTGKRSAALGRREGAAVPARQRSALLPVTASQVLKLEETPNWQRIPGSKLPGVAWPVGNKTHALK